MGMSVVGLGILGLEFFITYLEPQDVTSFDNKWFALGASSIAFARAGEVYILKLTWVPI